MTSQNPLSAEELKKQADKAASENYDLLAEDEAAYSLGYIAGYNARDLLAEQEKQEMKDKIAQLENDVESYRTNCSQLLDRLNRLKPF